MFMLVCSVHDIVPYQESTTLQLCHTAVAVGNIISVRSQRTDSRQHAESTTLQPCRTAAAVQATQFYKNIFRTSAVSLATPFMCAWRVLAMLRRVACVGACHNLSPHHTSYRTFLLCCRSGCACLSMRKHRDLCNSNN